MITPQGGNNWTIVTSARPASGYRTPGPRARRARAEELDRLRPDDVGPSALVRALLQGGGKLLVQHPSSPFLSLSHPLVRLRLPPLSRTGPTAAGVTLAHLRPAGARCRRF